jgi:FlaG/FlaF family flagellin (archaellin)
VADLRLIGRKKRVGVAEITGSLLMIALTIIAGAAVFGWAISQAGTSEGALGQNAAQQANYYHESFVAVSVQFSYNNGVTTVSCPSSGGQYWCNQVSVAVYNNGGVGLTVQSIVFGNATDKSASGYVVPKLSVSLSLTSAKTGTYNMPSYTCGSTSGVGTPENLLSAGVSEPIATQSSPPTVFTFTLPSSSCATTSSILDGALYSVQVVGLYGNVVTSQVTANG